MAEFPTEPGSVVVATATDRSTPTVYMACLDPDDDAVRWVCCQDLAEPYSERELTLVRVVHRHPGWVDG